MLAVLSDGSSVASSSGLSSVQHHRRHTSFRECIHTPLAWPSFDLVTTLITAIQPRSATAQLLYDMLVVGSLMHIETLKHYGDIVAIPKPCECSDLGPESLSGVEAHAGLCHFACLTQYDF